MNKVKEVSTLFFKLGLIAFGGPAAHIAMVHEEVVEKKKWMSDEHYLDLVSATALIPGPNSTEAVLHCGHHRAGFWGLIAAGVSFIFPACLLTLFLAVLYVQGQSFSGFEKILIPLKPAVMILIFMALKKLYKKSVKDPIYHIALGLVFILSFFIDEVFALVLGSVAMFCILKVKDSTSAKSIAPLGIFLVFSKVGAILFGSGYVLISYLQSELVTKRGWLTTMELADSIAIGQFTPGPVLSTSTFVGYLLGSYEGAILATIGIFLPSFFFVWALSSFIPKMRQSKNLGLLLNCVNAGVIGLMAYALVPLGKVSLTSFYGVGSLVLLSLAYWKFKLDSIKLVSLSLILGVLIFFVG